jgi:hypothetical protein
MLKPTATSYTMVIRNDDDSDVPLTGAVLGWEDEDRCVIAWGDTKYAADPWRNARIEFADEIMPWGRAFTRTA